MAALISMSFKNNYIMVSIELGQKAQWKLVSCLLARLSVISNSPVPLSFWALQVYALYIQP